MRIPFLSAAALALALATAAPGAATAHRSGVDRGLLIVAERYSADNGGNPQLVAVNAPDGSAEVLTDDNADTAPEISHDGKKVLFNRCVSGIACDQPGKINVWIMRIDGSGAQPLTTCDGSRCLGAFDPAFSADDRRIVFTQDLLDSKGVNFNGVFVMRADGTHQRRLTSRSEDQPPDTHPRFSPDGSRIVFSREVEDGARLMTMNADGTDVQALLPGVDAFDPEWSPTARRIAFTMVGPGDDPGRVDVATIRPDGNDLRVLTPQPNGNAAFQPSYSPTGSRIVFSENGDDGCRLSLMNPSGSQLRPVGRLDGVCSLNASMANRFNGR
ncbi:PD40 domain-containing protein [Nocardioides sp. CGMCC 1.13656]|nr:MULTISPECIES: PD40 domain-containing protein [unclassified Nocardioides]MBA2953330.1 PD40 domain-containing protein [Nocardioides sp. CGMCC 1.13656]